MLDKGKLDHKTQKLLSREIEAMEEVHHPNILRLYEVIETLSMQYFVMEYAPGKCTLQIRKVEKLFCPMQ